MTKGFVSGAGWTPGIVGATLNARPAELITQLGKKHSGKSRAVSILKHSGNPKTNRG